MQEAPCRFRTSASAHLPAHNPPLLQSAQRAAKYAAILPLMAIDPEDRNRAHALRALREYVLARRLVGVAWWGRRTGAEATLQLSSLSNAPMERSREPVACHGAACANHSRVACLPGSANGALCTIAVEGHCPTCTPPPPPVPACLPTSASWGAGWRWRACRRPPQLQGAAAARCCRRCPSSCCPSSSSCWHTTPTSPMKRWVGGPGRSLQVVQGLCGCLGGAGWLGLMQGEPWG